MTYLTIARTAVGAREKSEKSEISLRLSPEDAEQLKARIIEAATVEPEHFDRDAFDRLWRRREAHHAACSGDAP